MLKNIKLLTEKNKYIEFIVKFIYYNTYLKYKIYKINKNFLKNATKVLENIDKVFKELNIDYWLDFGTLLGAYRNNDFIQHDTDIDLGAFLEQYNAEYCKVFEKYGFKKIIDFTIDNGIYGREETYEYLGVHIDIFYYTKIEGGKAFYHDFITLEGKSRESTVKKIGGLIPRELTLRLSKIEMIKFKGREYPVPSPLEEHLSDRYGNDFMIENSSWQMENINKNIKILNNKLGILNEYR